MASSLLLLLDDIATVLDDVAVMSKMAAKKTAGVLGDDLALNAQQVSGVRAERELPVVWRVAKGSFINKLILVPLALLISVVAPWLINPLLVVGGLFLSYEGVEKIMHTLQHKKAQTAKEAKMDGKWVFTLDKPSMIPFLQYAKNRELREKIYRGLPMPYNRCVLNIFTGEQC